MACHKPTGPARALRALGGAAIALACLAAASLCFGAPAVASPSRGVGTARARVAALDRTELAEARTVHVLTVTYRADAALARRLQGTATSTAAHLSHLRHVYAGTLSVARADAIFSYVGGIPVPPLPGSGADFATREAASNYEATALETISRTMTDLSHQQDQLASLVGAYRTQLARALSQEASAATSRRRAIAQALRLQDLMTRAQRALAHAEARSKAPAGPPVGNGLVKAITDQLDRTGNAGTGRSPRARSIATSPGAPSPTKVTTSTYPLPTTTTARTTTTTATTTTRPTTTTSTSTSTSTSTTVTTTTSTSVATTTTATAPPTTTTATTPAATTTTVAMTTTTLAPAATTSTPGAGSPPPPPLGGVWLQLRECESGNDYVANSGNGFYGAYQFSAATWSSLGYPGRPDLEPYWMQDQAAERLHASEGWSPWPACSAALGL